MVIVDPGIKAEKGYPAHDRGLAAGVFIKDVTGAPYLGQARFVTSDTNMLTGSQSCHLHASSAANLHSIWPLERSHEC